MRAVEQQANLAFLAEARERGRCSSLLAIYSA